MGVQLILLAPLETFNLTSGKQFVHKLKIIQSKLCKCIRSDKEGGGVVLHCEVKKSEPVVETELKGTLFDSLQEVYEQKQERVTSSIKHRQQGMMGVQPSNSSLCDNNRL